MTLPRRLNHYEILELIGSGGMGEVYRARDTKLGREVAIKVLPEDFSQDKERLARFEREAKTLAALNHPNIATLFGLEECDGAPFLVMELVEGETLAERIARGAIPMEELLPLFEQIAKGVEAAHEKGILHRDLKPANVKITPDDDIKILDFGLAKVFQEEAPVSDSSQSPTLSRGTQLGTIMGTASYMSPEQARGKALDRRSDVWAFGCCLYEAVTGKKAFDGETVTDVLSAILEREPDWSVLAEPTPRAVRAVLARCLTKNALRRYHHLADARLDLEGCLDRREKEVSTSISFRERLFAPLILGVILVASIAVWALLRPDPEAPRYTQRFTIPLPFGGGTEGAESAFSPDGSHLVFVGSGDDGTQLYVRPLDEVDAVSLRGTDGASQPFFSPDGKWIGFFAGRTLKKVALAGGPTLVIAGVPGRPYGASWGTNDDIFFAWQGSGGLFRVSADGGNPESVTTTDLEKGDGFHSWPDVLPGGRALLFSSGRSEGSQDVEVQSLGTGERRVLIRDGSGPRYVSSGHLLFVRARALFAVPFDPEELRIEGVPFPVLEGLRGLAGGSAELSLSRNGSLAYTVGGIGGRLEHGPATMVIVDREGMESPLTSDARLLRHGPRLSPDGKTLALRILTPGQMGGARLWFLDVARETFSRFMLDPVIGATWSPHGETLFMGVSGVDLVPHLSLQPVDGGDLQQLTDGPYRSPTSISSDRTVLLFRQSSERTGWDIGKLQLGGPHEPELVLASKFDEHSGVISPNDRWLAYVSNETGREDVYLTGFPALDDKQVVSPDGGNEPVWARDGSELFYRSGNKMMAVRVEAGSPLGRPTVLFEGQYQSSHDVRGADYDVTPDGRFVMTKPVQADAALQIHVVLNWFEELQRLVPTNGR